MYNGLGLYLILPSLCPKAPEPQVGRLLYPLHHYHQVAPLHLVALRVPVILRQLETPSLQTLHIHHHAAVLSMKQLHQTTAPADEDEDITVPHITLHPLMHHSAKRTDALAHIRPAGAQIVAHRVIQAEHGSQGFCPTIRGAHPRLRCQSGHEDRWGTEGSHLPGRRR